MLDKKAIGERIELRRAQMGMQKGELAKLLDRDATRMSSYLRGEDLTLDVLGQIADHLECSLTWLIEGDQADPDKILLLQIALQITVMLNMSAAIIAQRQVDSPNMDELTKIREHVSALGTLLKSLPALELNTSLTEEVFKHGFNTTKGTDRGTAGPNRSATQSNNKGNTGDLKSSESKKRKNVR